MSNLEKITRVWAGYPNDSSSQSEFSSAKNDGMNKSLEKYRCEGAGGPGRLKSFGGFMLLFESRIQTVL